MLCVHSKVNILSF